MNKPKTDKLLPVAAFNQLLNNQTQLDMDGVMVGVSRQALDEIMTYVQNTRTAPPVAGELIEKLEENYMIGSGYANQGDYTRGYARGTNNAIGEAIKIVKEHYDGK